MNNRSGPSWMDLNADEAPGDVVLPVETRVKQGMALLDEKHGPEWVHRIDVDTLNLAGTCSCVLGQIYGDYSVGTYEVFPKYMLGDTADHGFFLPDADHARSGAWDELTTAWRHAILARRLAL